jgi:hypothetical protein
MAVQRRNKKDMLVMIAGQERRTSTDTLSLQRDHARDSDEAFTCIHCSDLRARSDIARVANRVCQRVSIKPRRLFGLHCCRGVHGHGLERTMFERTDLKSRLNQLPACTPKACSRFFSSGVGVCKP